MANQITTFYSYKGGTGRSMALANTAVLLAKWGYKVLMVDWDLEAPGLEHFFSSYLNPWLIQDNNGLVDLLDDAFKSGGSPTRIKWNDIVMNIRMPECAGSIDLITSGRRDDNYFPRLRRFDVKEFYQKRKGGYYIERLRNDWKNVYDHIVIDSRTGITDLGGICTAHLPDVITLLFTPTEQSVGGTLQVYRKIQEARQRLTFERLNLVAIPVPSRIDTGQEFEISQKWLDHVAITFEEVYSNWLLTSINKRKILEITKLPYISYFSFGEKLPVIEQGTTDPAGLGYAYEALAGLTLQLRPDVPI